MKVVFTEPALADLDEILAYVAAANPGAAAALAERIGALADQISTWPASGRRLEQRPDIRVLALRRFPFRMFYTVVEGRIEILHIRHAARRGWTPPE